ncbi:MAG: excinuclease ABC subunit UvrA [Bacillota bacterium]|jgi:excinuclease ABC subunit A|nr:excinuclease ABC subunit UvrA [Bacillota bacterium]
MKNKISIVSAKENNLKAVTLDIPRDKFIVMTGLSGSGKTSLAFDTIYAEGQRRYIESLSTYARQFLGGVDKPNVESIEGLSPAIAIDQKSTSNNPRSTVGTITEIYDFLRLLFARIGVPYCPVHNEPIKSQTINEMLKSVMTLEDGARITIMAPVVKQKKGTHKDLLARLLKDGFIRAEINGEIKLLEEEITLDKNFKHDINVVIDRMIKREENRSRVFDSIETALSISDGLVLIKSGDQEFLFSNHYACKYCGFSVPKLEPRLFSFNSPLGACHDCNGLGFKQKVDIDILIPDYDLSINQGGIRYYRRIVNSENLEWKSFKVLLDHYNIDQDKSLKDFTSEEMDVVLYGSKEPISYSITSRGGITKTATEYIEGVITLIERRFLETTSALAKDWYGSYMSELQCSTCKGKRLNELALSVRIGDKNIIEWTEMSIKRLIEFIKNIQLTDNQRIIAENVLKEINNRLCFLRDVGLEYLTLDRMAGTLSGGEAQRIRLATQIGSRLTGVLYVLDEPSIGLHQKDNAKLIQTLKNMRDLGNTLIVVEHDEETMREADWIVDVGPLAGVHGGEIVYNGPASEIVNCKESITGQYLAKKRRIEIPEKTRSGNGSFLIVQKAAENNLKDIDVKIPLGTFVCVTGVSGSGKSTLVNEIIGKSVRQYLGNPRVKPGKSGKILGLENIDKIIEIDQNPIGRTPRSNPATYTSVFDDIRDLFALTPEAKLRGYTKSRFSFNVPGGRCDACLGDGVKRISMNFLPDVYVVCDVCDGKRYNEETLQVYYKGKNIYDVLEMTVEDALEFFGSIYKIKNKLQALYDVGLGYIKLGQSATTISGGEAQRVKLASELQKRATGKTLFILDEPTTGLHSYDVDKLLKVLQRIVDNGDTVIVIEHNLDVIKNADYIIDLGPDGGDYGGNVVACGTVREVSEVEESYTGQYLKRILEEKR